MKNQKICSGFSLLEMVIIICIMAMVIGYNTLSWHSHKQKQQLVSAARLVFNFLYDYQQQSMWFNEDYLISFPPDSGSIRISSVTAESEQSKATVLMVENGVQLIFPALPIIFYGKRNMAQGGTIGLRNQAGEIRIIISGKGRIRQCSKKIQIAGAIVC